MDSLIASIANYLSSVFLLITGLIYLFKNSFMPYHSVAVAHKWEELDKGMQVLIIALMRAVAGGFLGIAIAIAFLQYRYTIDALSWIPPMILGLGVFSGLCTLYATMIVRTKSPGKPPTFLIILGIIFLVIGYFANIGKI